MAAKCENMIGKSFSNLSQRVVYSFLSSVPEFRPAESAIADRQSQRQMYAFLMDVLNELYTNPAPLALPLDPDDSFEDMGGLTARPELRKCSARIVDTINDFYLTLIAMGQNGELAADSMTVN